MRWLEARVQDLEDSRELAWSALVAPLYDRVHRIESELRGDRQDVLDGCATAPGAALLPEGRLDADWILRNHFIRVLQHTEGNLNRAAQILAVSEKTVRNWRRQWDIDCNAFKPRQGLPETPNE